MCAYRASGLPAGLSIDSASGKISGTPTSVGEGLAIVTESTGGATAFTWTVHHGPIVGPGNNCVDDYKGGTDDNSTIVVWPCNTGGTQLWTVGAKDTLEIQHKCLTVAGDATAAGSLIVLFQCRGAASQVWQQQADGTIVNPASGRCLNAPNLAAQTQFTLADCTATATTQGWRLPTTPAPPTISNPGDQRTGQGSTVSLAIKATSASTPVFSATGLPAGLSIDAATGVVSGKVSTVGSSSVTVTVTADKQTAKATFGWEVYSVLPTGTITHSSGSWCVDTNEKAPWVWDCNHTGAQTWTVQTDGRLVQGSNQCLSPASAGTAAGTKVVLSDCATTDASQVWQPKDGTLVNTASGRCLTADGVGYFNRFTLATCAAATTQQWTLPTLG